MYVDGARVQTIGQPGATANGLRCGRPTSSPWTQSTPSATARRARRSSRAPPRAPTRSLPARRRTSSATSRTPTSIALSWSASSDNVGVTGYGLYRGGALQPAPSAQTTGIFAGLTCNTNYTLAVDAYDAAANRSTRTTVMVSTTACPDTQAPSTPTGLAATNVTQNGPHPHLERLERQRRRRGYDVFRNGTQMASGTIDILGSDRPRLRHGVHIRGVCARRSREQLRARTARP